MAGFDELLEMHEADDKPRKDFKPLWTIKATDKEAVHTWLKDEFKYLMTINSKRHSNMFENLLIYQGIQFSPNDQKTLNDFLDTSRINRDKRRQKLVVNHLFDITETIVSRTTRNAPAPEVIPFNSNEIHDRKAAEVVGHILSYLAHINKLRKKDVLLKRLSLIGGESYASVLWNPDIGDLHPAWVEASQNGFLDEDGKPLKDENGQKLNLKNPVRTGEVEIKVIEPWRVLLEDKSVWEDVDYCFTVEIQDVEELKKDFPKSKDKIKPLESQRIFDTHKMTFRRLRNETFKIKFYHKKTKYMPEGFEATFNLEALFEDSEFRYEHMDLPIARLTDIDMPNALHGMSNFENTKGMQWRHNQLSSDIVTAQRLCAKPKWIVPKGRVKLEQLGNDITIVQYSGQVPPRLESPSPTPVEIFTFRDKIQQEMEQISTVTGVARRDVPSQIHASVTLRFLSEMEAERVSVSTSKHNELIRDIYALMMSVAGTYYDESDGRTMRVLGNDEEFHIEDMKVSNLNKPYDVIIRNTGALPETKASKEARVFDLLEKKPDLLTDAQLVDMLDLGTVNKVTTIVTESLRAAESENERFLKGEEVLEPAVYEDFITHWKTHVQKLQSHSIKYNADPNDLARIEEHIWGTEFLMTSKAKENPTFSAELANLKLFPIFYRDGQGFTPSSRKQQEAVVQGQANRGEELTEQIGGTPDEFTNLKDIQNTDNKEGK